MIQKSFEEELQKSIAEIYSSRFNEDSVDGYDLEDPGDDCDYEVGYDPYLGSFTEEM